MLLTKEQQQKFYDNYIKTCLNCRECPIHNYCGDNQNNLNIGCWNVYQEWLKTKILAVK